MAQTPTEYISVEELRNGLDKNFITALADDDPDGAADSGILEWACLAANAYVSGDLKLVTDLPIEDEDITYKLKDIALAVAIYKLARRHGPIPAYIMEGYADAKEQLKDIREYLSTIGDENGDVAGDDIENVYTASHEKEQSRWNIDEGVNTYPYIGFGRNLKISE